MISNKLPFMLQGMIQNFVRSTLSLTFVIAAARVVFNIKARMAREASWQLELKGDLTKQRRVEAVDKLLSVMTLLVSLVFGLQAIGLDGKPTCLPCIFSAFHSQKSCQVCKLLLYIGLFHDACMQSNMQVL